MAYIFEINGVLYKGDCVNVVSALGRKIREWYRFVG